jgi:hypothetical protein
MITIYQINTQIGQNAIDAKRKLMFGPEDFTPDMLQYFRAVAEVHTDDLEKAFEATNIPTGIIVDKIWQMSSSSVGDIFSKDGRFYMVDDFGFEELRLFNDEIEKIGMAA